MKYKKYIRFSLYAGISGLGQFEAHNTINIFHRPCPNVLKYSIRSVESGSKNNNPRLVYRHTATANTRISDPNIGKV
jgi:hypothetical protein